VFLLYSGLLFPSSTQSLRSLQSNNLVAVFVNSSVFGLIPRAIPSRRFMQKRQRQERATTIRSSGPRRRISSLVSSVGRAYDSYLLRKTGIVRSRVRTPHRVDLLPLFCLVWWCFFFVPILSATSTLALTCLTPANHY
jgi:hypothetical protein